MFCAHLSAIRAWSRSSVYYVVCSVTHHINALLQHQYCQAQIGKPDASTCCNTRIGKPAGCDRDLVYSRSRHSPNFSRGSRRKLHGFLKDSAEHLLASCNADMLHQILGTAGYCTCDAAQVCAVLASHPTPWAFDKYGKR